MTEKVVILARGLGTRMRRQPEDVHLDGASERVADRGLKALIPMAGRPFLDYVVDPMLRAGLRRVCLVIAPGCGPLQHYARSLSERSGAEVCWAVQEEPLGTADAVLAARSFAGPDPFVVANSDNLYPRRALERLVAGRPDCCRVVGFDREALVTRGNIARDRVGTLSVLEADEEGNLLRIVEKPADPERHARRGRVWVGMNLYRFTPAIFDACESIEPDPERGELELTTAVQALLDAGRVPFELICSSDGVLDLTGRRDVVSARRALRGHRPDFPPPEKD